MVYVQVTRKFPNLQRSDIGLFTNDEGLALTGDLAAGETDIMVDDASRFEPDMWLPLRSGNGLEVVQVVSVSYALNMITVRRAQDGTVAVPHQSGQESEATMPAKALNQIVVELLAHQSVLSGNAGTIITVTTDYTITQDFIVVLVDCTAGPVTITLPAADPTQQITIKKIAGPATNEVIIEPQAGETVDGDVEARIRFINSSGTLTSDSDGWWLI